MFTPNDIEVLIHCYVSPSNHRRINAPAVRGSVEMFKENGIIDMDNKVTERGETFLKMILSTPFPVTETKWIDPRFQKVSK